MEGSVANFCRLTFTELAPDSQITLFSWKSSHVLLHGYVLSEGRFPVRRVFLCQIRRFISGSGRDHGRARRVGRSNDAERLGSTGSDVAVELAIRYKRKVGLHSETDRTDKADFQSGKLKVHFLVVAHALTEVMHILKAVDRRRDTLHPGLYLQRQEL